MKCDKCGNESKLTRLGCGWKKHAEATWCPACWKKSFCLRAITIPVVRPLGEGVGWPELRAALKEAWGDMTAATNFINAQLWARDTHRQPGDEKLAKMPKTYLYPEIRARFPRLPSQAVASLEQAVKAKYMAKRYDVIWTGSASLPSARYPQPIIVPGAAWKPLFVPAGKDGGDLVPAVDVTILCGERFTLQLRGGKEFARQIAGFRQMASGEAIKGEMQLLQQRANRNDNLNGMTERDSGNQKIFTTVHCKMVAWFPRKDVKFTGAFAVSPSPDALLIGVDAKQNRLWTINGDDARRIQAMHTTQLDRWSDDSKMEVRHGKRRGMIASRREDAAERYHRRMDTKIKQVAAQVVGYAKRNRFASVLWIERPSGFLATFPWAALKTRLGTLAHQEGLEFKEVSDGEFCE